MNIPLNYFYSLFKVDYSTKAMEATVERLEQESSCDKSPFNLLHEVSLEVFEQSFRSICGLYLSMVGKSKEQLPDDLFGLIDLCLSVSDDTMYKESFLFSIQFIYSEYLAMIGQYAPTLCQSTQENEEALLQITLDANYHVNTFEGINLSNDEMTKLITKYMALTYNHQIGPMPQTRILVREDYQF